MSTIAITVVSGETIDIGLSIPGVQGPIGQSTLPSGGSTGQIIVKQSATNYDAAWASVASGLALISPTISGTIAASGAVTVFASGDSAGFFGASPVLCPSGITIPSGGSSANEVGAALSGVIVALRNLGLVRS